MDKTPKNKRIVKKRNAAGGWNTYYEDIPQATPYEQIQGGNEFKKLVEEQRRNNANYLKAQALKRSSSTQPLKQNKYNTTMQDVNMTSIPFDFNNYNPFGEQNVQQTQFYNNTVGILPQNEAFGNIDPNFQNIFPRYDANSNLESKGINQFSNKYPKLLKQ